jgi:MFS family permease
MSLPGQLSVKINSLGVLIARVGAGFLLDHFDAGRLGAIFFSCAAVGIALLVSPLPTPLVWLGAFMIGAALGAEGGILGYVTRLVFGTESYGTFVSVLTSGFLLGVLIGPLVAGASYDYFGTYRPALVAFILFSIVAAGLHAGLTRDHGKAGGGLA